MIKIGSKKKVIVVLGPVILLSVLLVLFFSQNSTFIGINSFYNPIKHIVVIVQENHSFDNYFGTYPGANGINNICIPLDTNDLKKGCVKPFLTKEVFIKKDLPHLHENVLNAYNNGKMDGFMLAENEDNNTMSYYDSTSIPFYWDWAKNYVLADNFFSSAKSYSLPNHWYLVAGQSPKTAFYDEIGASSPQIKEEYFAEANRIKTISDLLLNSNTSWKYYDYPIKLGSYNDAVIKGNAIDYLNPFVSKESTYTERYLSHFVKRSEIFTDLKNDTLPQVSWVIPSMPISDHPGTNVTLGMIWVTHVVDSIMNSRYQNDTVVIVTWDDYGGYYDHVPPPSEDEFGLGFRVPTMIISPYTKTGYIDHTQYSFESILRFIEWKFGINYLTDKDAKANNLLNAFDFNQKPRIPHTINLTSAQLNYIQQYIESDIEKD